MVRRNFPRFLFFCLATAAAANPKGGIVLPGSGDATIQEVDKVLTVIQSTDKAIIHWDSFSSTASETIRFQQPSATSVTLNRVVGVDPSLISGALEANGRLFLLNPNGIVFGPTARVNVHSLVASTLGISDDDFLNNRFFLVQDFSKELSSVVNQGIITAAEGGTVALVAPIVDNQGVILAVAGRVLLQAGTRVPVEGPIPQNAPSVPDAAGRAVRVAEVGFTPQLETIVNTRSVAPANRVERLGDGTVFLRGAGGTLVHSGRIEVDGTASRPSGQVGLIAEHTVGLGEGSHIFARPSAADPTRGEIEVAAGIDRVHSFLDNGPGSETRVHGASVVVAAGPQGIRTDDRNSLVIQGDRVRLTGAGPIGEEGKPLRVRAGRLEATTFDGNHDIQVEGNVTVDIVRTTRDIRFAATGRISPGRGIGDTLGQQVVVEPQNEGDPRVVHFISQNVKITQGQVGTPEAPIAYFDFRNDPVPPGQNLVRANVTRQINPQVPAVTGVDQPSTPQARPPFRPVFDPDPPPSSSGGTVIGAADNVLLSTLRTTSAKGEGEGGTRGSSSGRDETSGGGDDGASGEDTEVADRDSPDEEEESGGLITVVRRGRGRGSDDEDTGDGDGEVAEAPGEE